MQDTQLTAIYLRISDDREGRELGVERQREHCKELAARYDLDIYDIYNDNDRGASRYSRKPRKDYQRLLADAKAGRFTNIIAYTTGRLTRRPREHEDQNMHAASAALYSPSDFGRPMCLFHGSSSASFTRRTSSCICVIIRPVLRL